MELELDAEKLVGILKKAVAEGDLKASIGHNGNSENRAKELEAIYVKSVVRILKMVNKLSLEPIADDQIKELDDVKLPDENAPRKFFKIGDRVKICGTLHDFKYIHKNVPGWKKSMVNLYGQRGIVTDQHTKKDILVQVYFPDTFSSCALHTAALEEDNTSPEENTAYTPWKVGDFVQTSSHELIVKQLMLRLPDVPKKYYGEPGKVIAVTTAGIFVTYDGLLSYCIDSSLLREADREPVFDEEKSHDRNFKPGEEVKVISNLKKLIENQKDKGGWNRKMCAMAGKNGFVTDINGDGTIDVCTGLSRGWRMNADSIIRFNDGETEQEWDEELEFLPGDAVRWKITDDIRMQLLSKNIPLIFLEYLMVTGVVEYIDDDFDAWTRFNSTGKVCLKTSSLVKVTNGEKRRYDEIAEAVSQIKFGSEVYVDVGPPNYVRAILAQHCKVAPHIAEALMKKSHVIGWTDAQHAVIRYENGKQYRINKKYLTVRKIFDGKFSEKDDFNWGTVEKLRKVINDCVAKIHSEEQTELLKEDFTVDVFSMLRGRPPTVEFRIRSTIAKDKLDKICEYLQQDYGWDLEKRGTIIDLRNANTISSQQMLVGFLFNDDVYISSITSGASISDTAAERKSVEKKSDDKAGKIVKPQIKDVGEFDFFTLQNTTLSRTVCFPYVVVGPSRETEEPKKSENKLYTHVGNITVNKADTVNIGSRSGGGTSIHNMVTNSDVETMHI